MLREFRACRDSAVAKVVLPFTPIWTNFLSAYIKKKKDKENKNKLMLIKLVSF